jgi:16S rRNA (guanine527-N7)-methyltransferase
LSNTDTPTSDQTAQWRIHAWFPEVDDKTNDLLRAYWLELQKFNKVINLVSKKTILNADSIHFADSIMASRAVRKKVNINKYLFDLGSGNGFPGLVYAILYPDQQVVLMDSDERKCEFLKHVVDCLGLLNVIVQNKKIDFLPSDSIEQGMCRGFAPLPRALLMLRKIVSKGGAIYHLKSEEWVLETSKIPVQLCSIWKLSLEEEYILPVDGIKMYVASTLRAE